MHRTQRLDIPPDFKNIEKISSPLDYLIYLFYSEYDLYLVDLSGQTDTVQMRCM